MRRGEKRSFNLFAKRYEKEHDTGKTRLFELINSSKDFEEKNIKKQFSKKQDIKHLPVIAHQLFQLLLSSIREHAGKEYAEVQISKMMDDALLLYHRGIFQEAKNQIIKAKQLAYQIDFYHSLPQILALEIKIQERLLNLKELKKYKEHYWAEKEKVLNILQNELEYGKLSDNIYFVYRQHRLAGNEKDKQRYHVLMTHSLLQTPDTALSLNAKGTYHTIHLIYYNAIQDFEKAQKHIFDLIELYENNLQYLRFKIESYLIINNNAMVISLRLKDYINLFKRIEKLRLLLTHFPKLEALYQQRIFETTYSTELSYYIEKGKVKEGLELIPFIEGGLKKFPLKGISIDRYLGISIGIAIIYFFDKQLDESKKWIDKIIALEKEKTGLQIVSYAKILDLMLHYEWGNFLFLQNYISTVRQFLKRHQQLFLFENGLIKLLKKLSQAITDTERQQIITHYLMETDDTQSKNHFLQTHLKVHLWLKSLVEHQSFSHIIQSNK